MRVALDGRIERNSILDIFVRKVRLGFRAMTFERFCQLFERVVEYRDSATAEGAAAEGDRTPQAVPHLAACDLQAHVATITPYAVLCASLAIAFGSIPVGLGWYGPLTALALATAALVAFVSFAGTTVTAGRAPASA